MSEYTYTHLPAWRYKYGEAPKILGTEAELEAAAADSWVDSPAKCAGPDLIETRAASEETPAPAPLRETLKLRKRKI